MLVVQEEGKLEPVDKHRALVIIDMQRDFLEKGRALFCGEHARQVIEPIQKLIDQEQARGAAVFFTADTHSPDDLEFNVFPPHCLKGSLGAQVIPELATRLDNTILIEKQRFSAFFNTNLDEHLQEKGINILIICGVCTEICVLHTVADARNRDYAVEIPRDCVASFDKEAHLFALHHMEKILGARIVQGTKNE